MNYPDWKAPRTDRARLLWPDANQLIDIARAAGSIIPKSDATLGGRTLREVRDEARRFVGVDADSLLFVTGHQCELWHPGVWVKNVVIDAAARATNGRAIHLAVDTDAPKHLVLRWPTPEGSRSIGIVDDPAAKNAPWAGLIDSPTPAHLAHIAEVFAADRSSMNFEPLLEVILDSIRRFVLEGIEGTQLTNSLANACHELDWSLGLDYTLLTLSPLLTSDAWLTFVVHVLREHARLAGDYNAALADYRREHQINSTSRPVPDLHIDSNHVEVPLWLDDLGARTRARAAIELDAGRAVVRAGEASLEVSSQLSADSLRRFLTQHHLRFAPRALTLTTFMRLFIADVFLHGIGGGIYDQITDRFVRRHFDFDPPAFAVATATLYWPGAVERTRSCVQCVLQEGHRLRHALLGQRKRELVAAIADAPRKSIERQRLFQQMHAELRTAQANSPRVESWREKLAETLRESARDAVIFDRELFYALQPRDRLEAMIADVRNEFGV